jgi:hypothetical protein
VLSIGFASKPAFPPHPICHYYYLRGDGLEVFMDGLQFGEEAAKIFAHDYHRPLKMAKEICVPIIYILVPAPAKG